jgi:hypothetical protein
MFGKIKPGPRLTGKYSAKQAFLSVNGQVSFNLRLLIRYPQNCCDPEKESHDG